MSFLTDLIPEYYLRPEYHPKISSVHRPTCTYAVCACVRLCVRGRIAIMVRHSQTYAFHAPIATRAERVLG